MRAIDFWKILCYTGMFSALMEYILILFLTKEDKTENQVLMEKQIKRQMSVNIIERVAQFVLPFYNFVFPIIYFIICTL